MKKPVLILLAIMLILAGSVIANAQGEAKSEANKSWFDSFLSFFKSLFVKIFHTEQIKEVNTARNLSGNISEEKVDLNKATENKQETEIANITNITCGYCQYLVNDTCLNYSCCSNIGCPTDKICIEHECESPNCSSCQYAENHSCINYECCKDEDCAAGKICINRKCQSEGFPIEQSINFETVQKTDAYTGRYNGPCITDLTQSGGHYICVEVITNNSGLDAVWSGFSDHLQPEFEDLENYILAMVYLHDYEEGPVFVEIKNITQKDKDVKIYFDVWSYAKEGSLTAKHIIKIKRTNLIPRGHLDFSFIWWGEWKVENISV